MSTSVIKTQTKSVAVTALGNHTIESHTRLKNIDGALIGCIIMKLYGTVSTGWTTSIANVTPAPSRTIRGIAFRMDNLTYLGLFEISTSGNITIFVTPGQGGTDLDVYLLISNLM